MVDKKAILEENRINFSIRQFALNFTGSIDYENVMYSVQKDNNEGYFNYTTYLRYNINSPLALFSVAISNMHLKVVGPPPITAVFLY